MTEFSKARAIMKGKKKQFTSLNSSCTWISDAAVIILLKNVESTHEMLLAARARTICLWGGVRGNPPCYIFALSFLSVNFIPLLFSTAASALGSVGI